MFPVFLLVLLIGCFQYRSFHDFGSVTSAIEGVYRMKVSFEYQLVNGNEWHPMVNEGAAISLGDGYILGLTHVFSTTTVTVRSPWGAYKADVKPRNIICKINDKELGFVGEYEDISLFKAANDNDFLDPYPAKWVDSDTLQEGDRVVLPGFPWMFDRNFREGIVSDAHPFGYPNMDNANLFAFSINAIGGDSGSPVLVYRWGELKIVGLAQQATNKGVSFALKSNYVLNAVEMIRAAERVGVKNIKIEPLVKPVK